MANYLACGLDFIILALIRLSEHVEESIISIILVSDYQYLVSGLKNTFFLRKAKEHISWSNQY